MPKHRNYPTPALIPAPTGEGVVLEFPSGATTPFESMEAGESYVIARGLARSFGRVWKQVPGTKRFVQVDVDDGADID